MIGIHLLGEWFDCDDVPASRLDQPLRELCLDLSRAAGLCAVGDSFHQFQPCGVTGTVLLAESHLAIHTWPEKRFASVDVFVCNYMADNTVKAMFLFDRLRDVLRPQRVNEQVIRRGGADRVRIAA
jgi:S-adenosylmethionine decarboxylase proenzyme